VHLHPHMSSQLGSERRREMLAQAEQQHRARQPVALARASRRAERAERRMRRAVRKALRLRADWSNDSASGHPATHAHRARPDRAQPAAGTPRASAPSP